MEATATRNSKSLWLAAAMDGAVWRRALRLGLTVGLLQVAVNQGDAWIRHSADGLVIIKTIVSPAISLGIAWMAAAATYVDQHSRATGDI